MSEKQNTRKRKIIKKQVDKFHKKLYDRLYGI